MNRLVNKTCTLVIIFNTCILIGTGVFSCSRKQVPFTSQKVRQDSTTVLYKLGKDTVIKN